MLLANSLAQILNRWEDAQSLDFGVLALAAIVLVWFVSKYYDG